MAYCIYMHRNKINKKVYIGQTCQTPSERWRKGDGYKHCPYFYRAIQKYGWDNFEHIILFDNLTLDQANQKEIELINAYNSTNPDYGYNFLRGGSGKKPLSKETIEKIRKNNIGKHKISEETREKLRKSHLGQKPSEKQRAIARANSGFNNPRSKPVICLETQEIFGSSGEVERKLGISGRSIRAACVGFKGQKTAGGFHWKFLIKEEILNGNK